MNHQSRRSFPLGVAEKLKTYVYRLIDPRNGETFYVGKGQGDRVFAHILGERDIEGDDVDNKMKRIREIRLAGFEVAHVVHRHGMDEKTAFEVESALMDAYPGLTNIAGGTGSDFGVMHAEEIVRRYSAEPAMIQHRALLISVNRSAAENSLYEAVRCAWKISKNQRRTRRACTGCEARNDCRRIHSPTMDRRHGREFSCSPWTGRRRPVESASSAKKRPMKSSDNTSESASPTNTANAAGQAP